MGTSRLFGSLDSFVQPGEILGRGVANAGFLSALLSADPLDGYHFFLSGWEEIRRLEQNLRTLFMGPAYCPQFSIYSKLNRVCKL